MTITIAYCNIQFMYFMKCEQVGSLSLMIFDHDLYVCALWKTSNIYLILAGLDIGNNMSESLCKRKEKKYWIFHIILYFDSYRKCRKNYLHLKKEVPRLPLKTGWLINLRPKNRGGWWKGGTFLLQSLGPGWHRLKFL